MSWSIASIVIHPADQQFGGHLEANFSIQDILDGTESVVSYYGAKSEGVQMQFALWEDDNSNVGLSTLKAAIIAGTTVALAGDSGALGNYKILSFDYRRVQALNKTGLCYNCTIEMVKV